jgi:hypothetical protein
MTVPWTTTAGVLVDRVEPGMAGLWSLIRTAQRGVLRCATDAELDRDLAFTFAAMDLGEALEDLEWVHPDLAADAVTVDLGELPGGDDGDARTALGLLLTGGLDATARMLREQPETLDTADVLCLARTAHQLAATHRRLTGGPS